MASTPGGGGNAMRILYWLRRRGGVGTDEQMAGQLGMSGMDVQVALNALQNRGAVVVESRA